MIEVPGDRFQQLCFLTIGESAAGVLAGGAAGNPKARMFLLGKHTHGLEPRLEKGDQCLTQHKYCQALARRSPYSTSQMAPLSVIQPQREAVSHQSFL